METLYRKYRPQAWQEVIGQKHVLGTLINQIKSNKIGHAYLLMGARGIGKTTLARLFARSITCTGEKIEANPCGKCAHCLSYNTGSSLDIVELDAASNTGVDMVREVIIESARLAPVIGAYKVFIVDEVHMLSNSAFNALLKTIEEPPAHTVFIFATTDVHKVPRTIQSRCQRFHLALFTQQELQTRISDLAQKEGFNISPSLITQIAIHAQGSSRDAESILQQVLTSEDPELALPDIAFESIELATKGVIEKNIKLIKDARDIVQEKSPAPLQFLQACMDFWSEQIRLNIINSVLGTDLLEISFKAEKYMKTTRPEYVLIWFFSALEELCLTDKETPKKETGINREENIQIKKAPEIKKPEPKPAMITPEVEKPAIQLEVNLANISPEIIESGVERQPCALNEIIGLWPEFIDKATLAMPSLSIVLSRSSLEVRNEEIHLVTTEKLHWRRMQQQNVMAVLQKSAHESWGRLLMGVNVVECLPVHAQRTATENVASLDDITNLIEVNA